MLFVGLGFATRPMAELGKAFKELWASPELRRETVELFEVLADRARRPTFPLAGVPFHVHATYSRDEISAGLGQVRKGKFLRTQGGVYCDEGLRADILYVTLRKNEKEFTPTTLYNEGGGGITDFTRGRRESWERGRFEKDLAIEVLGRFPCPDLVFF
jgi:hypothetical protein